MLLLSPCVVSSWLETGLKSVYFDLECSQELIQADLHASGRNVTCLWKLESLTNLVHGALEDHRECRLHVFDHMILSQALKSIEISVLDAIVDLFKLHVFHLELVHELIFTHLEAFLVLFGLPHQIFQLALHLVHFV